MAEGDERPRVLGEFSDYNELITVLRARAAQLNLSGEAIDAVSGLTSRYSQKLLGPHQIRRLGATSLGPFLGALAVRCLIIEDKAALEKLRSQTKQRDERYVRNGTVHLRLTTRFFQKIGRLGGANSRKYLPKRLVKQLAKKAAAARWKKGAS
jgi:hypothetical protein